MRRIFGTRIFTRWKEKTGLRDQSLIEAVKEMEKGLIDADLGGYVLKKRIGLPGRGKRGSVRVIVATRRTDHWFFLYGFEKNEKENISKKELKFLQEIATEFVNMDDEKVEVALYTKELEEVFDGTKEK